MNELGDLAALAEKDLRQFAHTHIPLLTYEAIQNIHTPGRALAGGIAIRACLKGA